MDVKFRTVILEEAKTFIGIQDEKVQKKSFLIFEKLS